MNQEKKWSDASILKKLPNPAATPFQMRNETTEVTFLGVPEQPDFATIRMTFFPNNTIIELKSFKFYFHQFRNAVISYERFLDVVYKDLMTVYEPHRLRLRILLKPRGGIVTDFLKDSDWKILGGQELYKDWVEPKGW